jgi:hypothetical protein
VKANPSFQRVLDQLAHDRGGPLDHLARCDAFDHLAWQDGDGLDV